MPDTNRPPAFERSLERLQLDYLDRTYVRSVKDEMLIGFAAHRCVMKAASKLAASPGILPSRTPILRSNLLSTRHTAPSIIATPSASSILP